MLKRAKKAPPGTAVVKVDNPEFSTSRPEAHDNPLVIDAVVSLRESSVVTLASRGVLDADQAEAAYRFRHAWEVTRSIRPAMLSFEERVQSGHPTSNVTERRLQAAEALRKSRQLLGAHGYDLVSRVCGDGYHISDMYRTRRERDSMTDLLRIHLSSLAGMLGGSRPED